MVLAHPASVFTLCVLLFIAFPIASAQYLVNGQVFTCGLAIVDAPAPNSTYHAGSNIPIAIDVSGDGKLPPQAAIPGSNLATGFDSLELYLVSTQTGVNFTVSSGPGYLTQESGSTVKHLNFPLPNCVAAGQYNFTVYEGSHINQQSFFSITPIPISIENTNPNGPCQNGTNTLQPLPQPESPPSQNPFINTTNMAPLDTSSTSAGASLSSSTSTQLVIVTPTPSPSPSSPASPSSNTAPPTPIMTLTLGPSGVILPPSSMPANGSAGNVTGIPTTATVTETDTVTFVLVSVTTAVTTAPGQTVGFTTIITATATTSAVVAQGSNGSFGFSPINSALSVYSIPFIVSVITSMLVVLSVTFPP